METAKEELSKPPSFKLFWIGLLSGFLTTIGSFAVAAASMISMAVNSYQFLAVYLAVMILNPVIAWLHFRRTKRDGFSIYAIGNGLWIVISLVLGYLFFLFLQFAVLG